jgi:hypothetical protein
VSGEEWLRRPGVPARRVRPCQPCPRLARRAPPPAAPASELKRAHRERAAALRGPADPLLGAVAERLLDRLEDCVAKFPTAVILGGAGAGATGGTFAREAAAPPLSTPFAQARSRGRAPPGRAPAAQP